MRPQSSLDLTAEFLSRAGREPDATARSEGFNWAKGDAGHHFCGVGTGQGDGGGMMFLNETDRPTVDELIHGMIVNSGNDACVVVAEGLAGTEDAFPAQMTERARALGLMDSNFVNASGWPDPGQRMSMSMSMKDLGLVGRRLIEEFPQYYPLFSQTAFNYKDRAPANANNCKGQW